MRGVWWSAKKMKMVMGTLGEEGGGDSELFCPCVSRNVVCSLRANYDQPQVHVKLERLVILDIEIIDRRMALRTDSWVSKHRGVRQSPPVDHATPRSLGNAAIRRRLSLYMHYPTSVKTYRYH